MKITRHIIHNVAKASGFSACGIASVQWLQEDYIRLESYVQKGHQGDMAYLARDLRRRTDPSLLMPEARSVICLASYYCPDPSLVPAPPFRIARYALGKDYHNILTEKMSHFIDSLKEMNDTFRYRTFCDSGHLLEKAWARESGIGWIGKNTLLQVKDQGSWFLLGEVLTDLELEPDVPSTYSYCGTCTKCLDSCPTQALTEPYVLDAGKCISYLNSVYKPAFDPTLDLHGYIYGCDICQEVCPHNQKNKLPPSCLLEPNPELSRLSPDEWRTLSRERFLALFKDSCQGKKGYDLLVRNLMSVK